MFCYVIWLIQHIAFAFIYVTEFIPMQIFAKQSLEIICKLGPY